MSFNIDNAHAFINQIISSNMNINTAMTNLIDYCEKHDSKNMEIWTAVKKLNFSSDSNIQKNWLKNVLIYEPPSNQIIAFWFGIYFPIINQKTTYGYYINGSTEFSLKDTDWSCWDNDSYLPDNRYANSSILQKLYLLVGNGKSDMGEFILCLGYTSLLIKEICKTINPKLILGKHKYRSIGIGFDSANHYSILFEIHNTTNLFFQKIDFKYLS